jgi:hypothetical protein
MAASKKMLWTGYGITVLAVGMLLFSATMKLMKPQAVVQEFTRLGYSENVILAIGLVELVCTILYFIPRTSVLGAVLLTAYLGGATATHLRIADPFIPPIIAGVLVWAGLYLRDLRVRALLPLRATNLN